VVLDAGKRRGRHSLVQDEINQLIIDQARTHAVVVRLKGETRCIWGGAAKKWLPWCPPALR
jgi:uroporphyrin-III C-methyltransferase